MLKTYYGLDRKERVWVDVLIGNPNKFCCGIESIRICSNCRSLYCVNSGAHTCPISIGMTCLTNNPPCGVKNVVISEVKPNGVTENGKEEVKKDCINIETTTSTSYPDKPKRGRPRKEKSMVHIPQPV